MRNTFADELTAALDSGQDLVLLTADLGFTVLDRLTDRYPNHIINVGAAENAMVGVAAGLAMTGRRPIVYSIAKFLANKCYEQIREDICLHDLPVLLIGVGAGLAYGAAGYTHYSIQDIAALRTIPGITIVSPADPVELRLLLPECLRFPHPLYLRIGKSGEPVVVHRQQLRVGEAYFLTEGRTVALVTHGSIASEVLAARDLLEADGISTAVVSSPTIKPVDDPFFRHLVQKMDHIYVVEEHSEIGGLGDALRDFNPHVIAVPDRVDPLGGSTAFLRRAAGIDSQSIYERVRRDVVR